jgi:Protein of unknown function (DUF3108)
MKKIKFAPHLLLAIITLCSMAGTDCKVKNTSFKPGESITYKVYYHLGAMNVGAGEATFSNKVELYNGKQAYHISGSGKTYRTYDWFFKVRDLYETYVDTTTFRPMRFKRAVREGGTSFTNDVSFDFAKQNAVSAKATTAITPCTQDVLSMIYWSRNLDFSKLQPGDKIPFDMYIDEKVYNLYIRYLGKEKLKSELGTFNCIKFKPLLIKGTMFNDGENMNVWVTDDANHVPVRIEASISVGDIRADLISANGLRHGLTSWVKKYYD